MERRQSNDKRRERFSLEAFKFLGNNPFVYMHCKVKVCDADDPNSRCAQGCLRNSRRRRSLYTQETNDEEYLLAQGPFMRGAEKSDETESQVDIELHEIENSSKFSFTKALEGTVVSNKNKVSKFHKVDQLFILPLREIRVAQEIACANGYCARLPYREALVRTLLESFWRLLVKSILHSPYLSPVTFT